MPDLASRRLATTSWGQLPLEDTIPIPVTTTRFIGLVLDESPAVPRPAASKIANAARRSASRLQRGSAEQSDLQVLRLVDRLAIRLEPAVGDAEGELRPQHALEVDAVFDQLGRRQ